MKLYVKNYTKTQGFGANANGSYSKDGLKGHPATDIVFNGGWDAPIPSMHDGFIYKVFNKDNPDLTKYRAICTLFDDDGKSWELTYGHCNKILTTGGVPCEADDIIATQGNTGQVFAYDRFGVNKEITKAEKDAGSKAGTHCHVQLREVQKVKEYSSHGFYLYKADGYLPYKDSDGNYYLIPNYENGYNGCVDPEPYFINTTREEEKDKEKAEEEALAAATSAVSLASQLPVEERVGLLEAIKTFLVWLKDKIQ